VVQQFSIPSGSMEPTLHGDPRFLRGDRVLVNKWIYGIRIPFTNMRFFDYKDPERWDIVVFHANQENAEHGVLIKRVVGLPGEKVQIGEDGRIVINGTPVDPPDEWKDVLHYTRTLTPPDEGVQYVLLEMVLQGARPDDLRRLPEPIRTSYETIHARLVEEKITRRDQILNMSAAEREALVAGVSPQLLDIARKNYDLIYREQINSQKPFRYGLVDDPQYSIVPEGHYFVLGDNSGNSVDGRFFGGLPKGNILGRAASIWWPFTRARDFTGWTDTLWGKAIVYGLPALWIAYEICIAFFFCSWKLRKSAGDDLQPGDHVMVNRIALGFRLPFTSRRVTGGRPLRPGEFVLTRVHDSFVVAAVEQPDAGKGKDEIAVRILGEGSAAVRVPRDYVVGIVTSVWWPRRRKKKLGIVAGES
jgi:signal peptidase I